MRKRQLTRGGTNTWLVSWFICLILAQTLHLQSVELVNMCIWLLQIIWRRCTGSWDISKLLLVRGYFLEKNEERWVKIYTDADWVKSKSDRHSTIGYCSYVWGNLVTWRSKKQSVVARSSAGAKFCAIAHGICEGLWIKRMLEELKIRVHQPMQFFSDNKAPLEISWNLVYHNRTKHVEVNQHFIKEMIESGVLDISYTD